VKLSNQELFSIANQVSGIFEEREDKQREETERVRARSYDERERFINEMAAAERAEAEKRAANAEKVDKVAEALGCSRRYAQLLVREGTTKPATARKIAKALGTKPAEHLRRRIGDHGRKSDIAGYLMRQYVAGVLWRDFIEIDPYVVGEALRLRNAFAEAYKNGSFDKDHVRDLEPITTFARKVGVDIAVAEDLWQIFKRWRIAAIFEDVLEELAESNGDPNDFG
jgi:hypothetical protein